MSADPRIIELMSYYRDAELHGATLLLRLIKLMDDPDAQVKLSLHVAEETNHAWLWTKRITDLGGMPVKVMDGYQKRIGFRTVPRSLIDLLALTIVVEERAFSRYQEHLARPGIDEPGVLGTGNRKEDIVTLTGTFNQILEERIRKNPAEWVWWHRRWRRGPIPQLDLDPEFQY